MSSNTLLIILIIFLIFLVLICFLTITILLILIYTGVPFVKTPKKAIEKIWQQVKIKPTDVVYDLGCGDAQFLIKAEKKFGAKTIGFELSPWPFFLAKLNILLNKAKTKVFYRNFYKEDLSDANLIFCFLIDSVMPKVGKQLTQQLKRGAQVISFAFPIKEWRPTKVIETNPGNKKASKIYFYQR